MLPTLKRHLPLLLSLALIGCANAANDEDAVKKALAAQLPGKTITSVKATPMKGIYEVVLRGKQIVYTDAKGEYLLVGDMVEIKSKKSLTEARHDELNVTDFGKLPFELAFKEVRGKGERRLAVFTDPDCPFCRKLETDSLAGIDNVTVYRFLMPLQGLHPDAARKSRQIWCEQDRVAAWMKLMHTGQLPNNKGDCGNDPLAKTDALAQELGITGTPGLVFAHGEIVGGAIPKEEIEKRLDKKAKP